MRQEGAQDYCGFLIVWEFRAMPGAEKRFEEAYGPDGVWVRFFAQADGYVGTELNQDLKDRSRYITVDLWRSEADYDRFREEHRAEYEAIDRECQALTEKEREIGLFERVGGR